MAFVFAFQGQTNANSAVVAVAASQTVVPVSSHEVLFDVRCLILANITSWPVAVEAVFNDMTIDQLHILADELVHVRLGGE